MTLMYFVICIDGVPALGNLQYNGVGSRYTRTLATAAALLRSASVAVMEIAT